MEWVAGVEIVKKRTSGGYVDFSIFKGLRADYLLLLVHCAARDTR